MTTYFCFCGAAAGGPAGGIAGFCVDGLVYLAVSEFAKECAKAIFRLVAVAPDDNKRRVDSPALRDAYQAVKRVLHNVWNWFKNLWNPQTVTPATAPA